MTESFEEVCDNIKACLNSSKNQMSMFELDRDYNSILGTRIPYQSLGYRSLEALLRAVPDLKISHVGRDIFIDVKLDEKTMHITNLVRGQKCNKKKPPNTRRFGYRRPPPPRRLTPPKSQFKPTNSRYGSQNTAPKQYEQPRHYEQPRYPTKSYDEPKYNTHSVKYNDTRPPSKLPVDSKNTAPSKAVEDPRSYGPRYNSNSESQNKAPKYYQVPQYNSRTNSASSSHPRDQNQNSHSSHNHEKSKPREKSPSPQFSPTFSDSGEDTSFIDLTLNGHSKPNLQVTSGNSRKVTVGRQNSRCVPNNLTKHKSLEEDFDYSSTNELQNSDLAKLSDTEFIISSTRKMSLKHTPAAMVAAGRAQIEPKRAASNVEMMDTSPIHLSPASSVLDEIYSQPFKMMNKQPATADYSELLINTNSKTMSAPRPHSSQMHGKMSPPAMNMPNSRPSPLNTPNPTIGTAKSTPSKMSDPFMFTPGPHIMPDCSEGSACSRLIKYTRMRNLPMPEFKNFNKPDPRTGVKYFLSRVKIGDFNFSSFQLESSNLKDAQEYVAKVALEDLHRRLDSVDSAVLPHTNNENTIIDRVAEIVNPHVTGLKASFIESQYKTLHREILPFNWIDIIENMSLLSVEKLVGGLFVYPASDENANTGMVTQLPELVLPLSNTWNVFVTVVSTPNRLYFRIIHDDYDGRFAVMSENMDAIYSSEESKKRPVEMIREGNFYAANIESKWFRVKVMAPVVEDKVVVMLIDVGDVDEISKDAVYPLDEQLTKLPAQAVRCGLTNLEEYCNNTYISEIIDDLVSERTMVAQVDSRNPRLQLTLIDTCTEEDININELVLEKIKQELTPPKIPAKNSLTPVRLTSVLEDGQAYVQLITDSLAVLEELLEKANEDLSENEDFYVIKDAKELVGSKMCLVKYIDDGKWHRGAVQKLVPDSNEAQVLYVDYGNHEIVPFDRIADCQRISNILCEIPPQAIRVELVKPTQEIFTEKIIEFLMNLALPKTPDDQPNSFIMKVVEDRNVPYVELFIRLSGDKEVHPVNDVIGTCFQEYRGKNFKMITISKELNEKFRPIPAFPLHLQTGEFYVYVYMVSNPHEFFVQPHDFRPRLKELMELMNELYSNEAPAVNIESLTKGQVYAVKCEDNLWYRGVCHQIIETMNSISVKLVDYGNIVSVKFKDIAHLLPCFRELPCLAIKAELAGIAPKNRDWDFRDCIRFKDLVYEKVLISFVVDANAEKASMVLFDTSMDKEVDIGAQLVTEGHAVDITEKI